MIFTNRRTTADDTGYAAMAARMEELARSRPGFVDIESVRGADRVGITVSYWDGPDAAASWKADAEHLVAQRLGAERWYEWYRTRVGWVDARDA